MAADTDQNGPDLTDAATFEYWTQEKIPFQDIDRLDHVNNVAIAAYAESGRVEFLYGEIPLADDHPHGTWVVVRLLINFIAQAHFPGRVEIGTRVLRLGTSSATLGQGMFVAGQCIATADSVVVLMATDSGRAVPLPRSTRTSLAGYMS